ncbi:hypothetical protein [Moraxella canis]|uniref:Uncharacterized protein n=1 Tax=Moraxella canis TaxID=90239 RepID=A0A1S9ZJ81_9GAMM|nr:hypothetical protein [Moraxella canis]OOR83440.1 hypothetical protein B0180_07770 [Moraxella canis]
MKWDIKQLRDEQTLLQPIHEKYLFDANLFRWFSNQMTDSENRKYTGKLIKEEQTQSGGIDILDKSSRIKNWIWLQTSRIYRATGAQAMRAKALFFKTLFLGYGSKSMLTRPSHN